MSEREVLTTELSTNGTTTNQPRKRIDLHIAGTGAVGGTLLKLLKKLQYKRFDFRLIGVCNNEKMECNRSGLDLEHLFESQADPTDWQWILGRLTELDQDNIILADVTGSEEVARLYPVLFSNGIHVATSSKLANTFEYDFYQKMNDAIHEKDVQYEFEPTVGAALPVVETLRSLINTGDTVNRIKGVVSGTMTYLFNQLENGVPFSEAIQTAREQGYAEPDPRDDLSGEDTARKFLILARTIGYRLERSDIKVESLIPEGLEDLETGEFFEKLSAVDNQWKRRFDEVLEEGKTLRYVGELKDGTINIGVKAVGRSSTLGQLHGSDNLIKIYSERYSDSPVILQGPGAGKEVTASGVLNDILKIAAEI